MTISNNPPIVVEIDIETAKFLLQNCDTNIGFALNALQGLGPNTSRSTMEKFVDLIEKFKAVKKAVTASMTEDQIKELDL